MNTTIENLTPAQIVKRLDEHIVGQDDAKRAVAIAMRNRWRRQQLDEELQREVMPKNILMIGPTGVGKTEIARRMAELVNAPFLKVEATKYTEVGYHGRDVESMIRDIVEVSHSMIRGKMMKEVTVKATENAEAVLIEKLIPPPPSFPRVNSEGEDENDTEEKRYQRSREKMLAKLRAGKLEDKLVEVEVQDRAPTVDVAGSQGFEQMGVDIGGMLQNMFPQRTQKRKITVKEAREILIQTEAESLVDKDALRDEALKQAQFSGIIFLDEIDKIAVASDSKGPDVSRGGVQRDLLPIVEGSTVTTRHGLVNTEHILFIAAGAFHSCKPSDLLPELQGRFPIRVELTDLQEADFIRILHEPRNAITKQYEALLATEGITLIFETSGLKELARVAATVNDRTQNIGARRLSTVVDKLLEEISFHAPDVAPQTIQVTAEYVQERLHSIMEDEDLSRYIL